MNIIKPFVNVLSSTLIMYLQLIVYARISDNKVFKINIKNILIILVCGIIICINTTLNISLSRVIITFLVMLLSGIYFYKDNMNKTFIYMSFEYLIMVFYELIMGLLAISIFKLGGADSNILFKTVFSLLIIGVTYLTVGLKIVKDSATKMINKKDCSIGIYGLFIIVLVFLLILDFRNFRINSIEMYISNIIILICTASIIVFGMYNYLKATREVKKAEILLEFIKKYEKVMDRDRILRHEMLNNLLLLNSYENKNSSEFNNALSDLIKEYSNSGMKTKNLHKLPSGVKGLLYCKLSGLEEEGFNINIRIPKNLPHVGKILDNKNYALLCRVIGIVLDNAIEAAKSSKDKLIDIEIISVDKNWVAILSNSCSKKVNMSKIEDKYYSTKGKHRGLGLYIAKKLLANNEHISLTREINGLIFTTKIVIK